MSLDVHLYEAIPACSHCGREEERIDLYSANITHNLGTMAEAAGIYEILWRPEELGYSTAKELIPRLEQGLLELKSKPEHYKVYDSPNGWGLYIHFVPFVEKYLNACKEFPEASVYSDR